jgi:hypothetical protein
MLDQQHGHLLEIAHAADLLAQNVHLFVIEPGSRLVEQQQLGVAGQCTAPARCACEPETAIRLPAVAPRTSVHEPDELLRALGDAPFLGAGGGKPKACS